MDPGGGADALDLRLSVQSSVCGASHRAATALPFTDCTIFQFLQTDRGDYAYAAAHFTDCA